MNSPLDPLMEALASRWWGRLVLAGLLFTFAGFMAFVVPAGRFDVCALGIAIVAAGIGLFFLVTGVRARRDRTSHRRDL